MTKIEKLKGDASFRKFFRKKDKYHSSIIIYAKKDKFKNLIVYDAINRILNKNGILAPKLFKENYDKNNIIIQDFGNLTLFKVLNKKNKNKFLHFKKIIKILNQIQLIKTKKIETFKKKIYSIPQYRREILINEANLFCDWYTKKKLSREKNNFFKKDFNKIIKKLISNLRLKNNIFVHRDFHISNLMMVKGDIGVIDTQDALIGNKAYDLASLIDDVRFKTSKEFKKKLLNFYLRSLKKSEKKNFKNDFEILSVIRNLKIIGVFTRLDLRDGKKKYLKLIPYTWKLIKMRTNENEIFKDLNKLLNLFFITK